MEPEAGICPRRLKTDSVPGTHASPEGQFSGYGTVFVIMPTADPRDDVVDHVMFLGVVILKRSPHLAGLCIDGVLPRDWWCGSMSVFGPGR